MMFAPVTGRVGVCQRGRQRAPRAVARNASDAAIAATWSVCHDPVRIGALPELRQQKWGPRGALSHECGMPHLCGTKPCRRCGAAGEVLTAPRESVKERPDGAQDEPPHLPAGTIRLPSSKGQNGKDGQDCSERVKLHPSGCGV